MLRLENLNKRYGDVVALDGASFTARRGRILGFLGPNGAGKTTAMRAVFGLVALDAGAITWDDRPVGGPDRLSFGYMPESRGLYPRMALARQLVWLGRLHGLGRTHARAAVLELLDRLDLGDRADDAVEQLSHGNQQRAQLAASLVHDPDLVVLDEPFSGLDPMGTDAMAEIVHDKALSGAAVVLSSHQLDLVEGVCDDVAIVHQGRVVLSGTIEEVREGAEHRRVDVAFIDPGVKWSPQLEGATALPGRNSVASFLVPSSADPAALLASASQAGSVRRFSFQPPALSEIFRTVVSA